MEFAQPLIHGTLVERYKRFLADIRLDTGNIVTAHCTNSGSMKSCLETGAEVWLSPASNPSRKTRYTWEMIKINDGWVGINTSNPNTMVYEAIRDRTIRGLDVYSSVLREVTFGESRLDLFAENSTQQCAIEVKNVSMKEGNCALFPDARTLRGLKHLNTLIRLKQLGIRAVMVYVIQRTDVSVFAPAHNIDPQYAAALHYAAGQGVEIFAMQACVTPQQINFVKQLPVILYQPLSKRAIVYTQF